MQLSTVHLARLELHIDTSIRVIRHMTRMGANQLGHAQHDALAAQLGRSSAELRRIGRNLAHTRSGLQVSKYKREAWNDRERRLTHLHGVDRVDKKLKRLERLIKDTLDSRKDRDSPNGGLFDLSKEIADGIKDYQSIISVDLRNDADALAFQSADVALDPIQGVIMLVGMGLELIRLKWEKNKAEKEFAKRNPNWK